MLNPDSPLYGGIPVWKLETWPGTKRHFGGEPKLAAWLYFNVHVGGEFTMRDLREALGAFRQVSWPHLSS